MYFHLQETYDKLFWPALSFYVGVILDLDMFMDISNREENVRP
jgi:hypothetical protein